MLSVFILPAVFIIVLFLAYINKKTYSFSTVYKYAYYIIGVLLLFAVTFRPSLMVDYSSYVNAYVNGNNRFEPAFFVISIIAHLFTDSHLLMMFIYGVISVSITMLAIYKQSLTIWYSVLVWLSYIFILQDMIQIRQAVSSAIFLYAVPFIRSKNLKKYILATVVATLFHYSALAMLPLYMLSSEKKYRLLYLFLIPVSYFLYIKNMQIIYLLEYVNIDFVAKLWNTKVNTLDVTSDVDLYNKRQIIQVLLCTFMWIKIDKIVAVMPSALLYLKIYTLAIVTFIIFFDVPDIASRINILYIIVEIIIVPVILLALQPRFLWEFVVIGIAFIFFITYYYRYILETVLL